MARSMVSSTLDMGVLSPSNFKCEPCLRPSVCPAGQRQGHVLLVTRAAVADARTVEHHRTVEQRPPGFAGVLELPQEAGQLAQMEAKARQQGEGER